MESSNVLPETAPEALAISQPRWARRRRMHKERSQPALWAIATIFFLFGSASTTLVIWQLHKLYQATVAPLITVEGTLRAQYGYENTSELRPDPSGYYVTVSGIERVYLTGQPLNDYVGQTVVAQGSVSGICGPQSIPCYPILQLQTISLPEVGE